MNTILRITDVLQTPGNDNDIRSGLLAFLCATINGRIRIDGMTLRRTANGRLMVSFPSRRDSAGRHHPIIEPLDQATRLDLEQQIFAFLGVDR